MAPHFSGHHIGSHHSNILGHLLKNLISFLIWIIISNNFITARAFTMGNCSNRTQGSGSTLYYHQSLCSSMPLIQSNSYFYSQKPLPLKEQLTNCGCSHQNSWQKLSRKCMKQITLFVANDRI